MTSDTKIQKRVSACNWQAAESKLDGQGWAILPKLLLKGECRSVQKLYADDTNFRNRVIMARHGYGRGEYRYFSYPLPPLVAQLRNTLYPQLMPIANRWNETMRIAARFPAQHTEFIQRCREAGQLRPTPLLLQYGDGDYNCLHQDLYGEHQFPFQVAILLSEPETDFKGGEFVLTEQRPRMQSRVTVVPLQKGDALIFAVNYRPAQGARGFYRMTMRHGVSTIRAGRRHTLGVIFHDAT